MPPRHLDLSLEQIQPGPGTLVTIAGTFDEGAALRSAIPRIGAPVTIDLAGVAFIDSLGVREWVDFLRALPRPIQLRRCSEALVYQFGMVRETLQDARVESFIAPYECEHCGHEDRITIAVPPNVQTWRDLSLPDRKCAQCQSPMVLAEHPERYLYFLGAE